MSTTVGAPPRGDQARDSAPCYPHFGPGPPRMHLRSPGL